MTTLPQLVAELCGALADYYVGDGDTTLPVDVFGKRLCRLAAAARELDAPKVEPMMPDSVPHGPAPTQSKPSVGVAEYCAFMAQQQGYVPVSRLAATESRAAAAEQREAALREVVTFAARVVGDNEHDSVCSCRDCELERLLRAALDAKGGG